MIPTHTVSWSKELSGATVGTKWVVPLVTQSYLITLHRKKEAKKK